MKPVLGVIIVLALLACACSVDSAYAQKKGKFTAKDLPPAVSAAFQKAYPKARILGASTETEHGVKYFEIESQDGSMRRDLLYTEDGKNQEIEETIAPGALPEPVKAALAKELPHAKILKAEKVTTDAAVKYEMIARTKSKLYEISFDPAGKLLEKKAAKPERTSESGEEVEEEENQ
jgi:hypothetical protein